MDPVMVEVASGATVMLAPFLAGVARGASGAAGDAGGQVGGGSVHRLWALLGSQPKVRRVADRHDDEDDDEDFEEDLARAIARVLERDRALADEVARLVDEARVAGAPAVGHALAERVRAHHDLLVEG